MLVEPASPVPLTRIGELAELWIYPVKSMRGLRVESAALEETGIAGDRRFAFLSSNAPLGKPLLSSRQRADMLRYAPQKAERGLEIRTPGDELLPLTSDALLERFTTGEEQFQLRSSPQRPLSDVRPVSLVSTATLAGLSSALGRHVEPQRFRSNLVLRLDSPIAFTEDGWSDRTLRFGSEQHSAELRVRERIPRCRMVSLDPDTAEPDSSLLKYLASAHQGRLGVYATVQRTGLLQERQPVYLL